MYKSGLGSPGGHDSFAAVADRVVVALVCSFGLMPSHGTKTAGDNVGGIELGLVWAASLPFVNRRRRSEL